MSGCKCKISPTAAPGGYIENVVTLGKGSMDKLHETNT